MVQANGCCILLAIFIWNTAAQCDENITVPNVLVKLSQYVEATALEAGSLVEMRATEGLEVNVGDLLARIDDEEEKLLTERARIAAEIAQREAENRVGVDSAHRLLKVSHEELRRAKEAIIKFPDTISQSEIDRLDLALEQAKLNLRKAEHELEQAELNAQQQLAEHRLAETKLARRQMLAPITGIVVRVDLKRGEWVEPGKKIIRIANMDRLRVEGVIDAKIASSLRQGMSVKFAAADIEKVSNGELFFISPEVDPFSQQVRIVAEVDNHNRHLRPGIKGTLIILRAVDASHAERVEP